MICLFVEIHLVVRSFFDDLKSHEMNETRGFSEPPEVPIETCLPIIADGCQGKPSLG